MPEDVKAPEGSLKEETKTSKEIRSQFGPSVYSNHAEVGFSSWDMRLRFSEIIGKEGDELLVDEKIKIVMSLHHAKAFVKILNESLKKFEEKHGEIQLISPKEDS